MTSREQGCWARERPDPPRQTDKNKRNSTVRYWQGEKETMLDWMPTLENDPCVPPSSACMRQHLLPEGCHSSLITTWLHACCAASVTSNSLWLYGLQPARLLCPWDSPGKNTGVGHHALLQGIFPTQGSNSRLTTPALAGRLFTPSATWEAHYHMSLTKLTSKTFWELYRTGNTSHQLKHKSEGREKLLDKECSWDFPGSPVVKTPHPQGKGPRVDPWWGN